MVLKRLGVHLSGVVGAIATAPALLAYTLRRSLPLPLSIVLWHVAAAGWIVALAASEHLAKHSTWVMGKNAQGEISTLAFALLYPYHIGLRAKLALQRRVSSEPSWSRVTEEYFIGAWPSEAALVPVVHAAVLDVTCELPLQVATPAYLALPVWDTHGGWSPQLRPPAAPATTARDSGGSGGKRPLAASPWPAGPDPDQIERGVHWAAQQVAAGRPVLVHCAHGHGRSATVLAAILIAEGRASGVAEAEALMQAQRPRVRLNRRQRAALLAWVARRKKQ